MSERLFRLPGRPSPKQALFLADTHKYVAFGGARGGGKSWAVRYKAVRLCLHYAGIKILIVRRTLPELRNNHINFLKAEIPPFVAKYNDNIRTFTFFNGSTILFGYLAAESDMQQYQGAEFDVIFLDEATQLRQEWITMFRACMRATNDFPKRMYLTCNPGGVSHAYIKRLFIDKRYEDGEDPAEYSFIQSLVTDNKALMEKQPDYVKQLEALPEKLRQAWLFGRWDIFEGQFFEELRFSPDVELCAKAGISEEDALIQRRFTHVIPAFMPPLEWTIMRSYDFGYDKPFSCGYWAVDFQGRLYRILEYYGCTREPNTGVKWSPDEQFRRLAEFEREHPYLRGRHITDSVADPAIWDASRGESIAETAMRYGIYFSPGDNARIPGWMQVHYRLQFDDDGYPRMYIFDTCKQFIRTMPMMMYSETKPEDLDTTMEDHIADEVRYMCMSIPIKPVLREERRQIYSDPLDQFGAGDWR